MRIKVKREGSLKVILSVLVIVLISLVSIWGVFIKEKNVFKSKLPEYTYGMGLEDTNVIQLTVKKEKETSTEDTQEESSSDKDAESKGESGEENNAEKTASENDENSAEEKNEEADKKEDETAENSEDIYTAKNYNKSKKIIQKRFETSGIDQYTIRLDEATGSMVIELPTRLMEKMTATVFSKGNVELKIEDNKEVIATGKNIKKLEVEKKSLDATYYGGGSYVTMTLIFDKESINKFEDIKNNYELTQTDEDGNIKDRTVNIYLDGNGLMGSGMAINEFLDSAISGSLPLTLGQATEDTDLLNDTYEQAKLYKCLMQNEEMPIEYEQQSTIIKVHSNINKNIVVIVMAIILAGMAIYLLIRYKLKGVLGALTILGVMTTLLLVIRFSHVIVELSSIIAMIAIMILQFLYVIKILNSGTKKKAFNKATLEYTKVLIPAFIMALIASFAPIVEFVTVSQVIFWGIIVFEVFNNTIARAMMSNSKK